LESFNFHVIEIDGHDFRDIVRAVGAAKSSLDKPTVIIAHTIPGKGVVAFEGDFRWHGKTPNEKEGKGALRELRTLKGKIIHGEM
jgi:transketolase